MKNKKIFFSILVLFASILVSGCTISFSTDGKKDLGGVFASGNRGQTWRQMVALPTAQRVESLSGVVVNDLAADPNDPQAIYMATVGNGMYYTYDLPEGWQRARGLPRTSINAVAVEPGSKCIIYASAENKLYKSTDCNRTWEPVYHDDDKQARITSIVVDHYDANRLFIGTSNGIVLRSDDRGGSWRSIHRVSRDKITGLHISPHDSRIVFATTERSGVYRTKDSGEEWLSLVDNMRDFDNRTRVRDLATADPEEGLIFVATDYGLLKSEDFGEEWSKIDLLTPERGAKINSVVVGPQDEEEIYYVTDTTFYRSLDGGVSWSTRELPTSRPGKALLINQEEPNIIYLGAGAGK